MGFRSNILVLVSGARQRDKILCGECAACQQRANPHRGHHGFKEQEQSKRPGERRTRKSGAVDVKGAEVPKAWPAVQ